MIRCFLALNLSSEIKGFIERSNRGWQGMRGKIRWVQPSNCHVTLKFLGDVDESLLSPISNEISKTISIFNPLSLSLSGTGVFPNKFRPRVLWLGLKGDVRELGRLKSSIDHALLPFGFKREERSFVPHITVARVKSISRANELEGFLNTKVPKASFTVEKVALMKSTLTPSGPIYSILEEFVFKSRV